MSLFQTRLKDGGISIGLSGYLTKDPKIVEKDGKPVLALFSVCYGKKKYMDCKVWSGSEKLFLLARCLEAHDVVSVAGWFETYQDREGKLKEQIVVDFIAVLQEPPKAGGDVRPAPADGGMEETGEEEDGELPF